MRLSANGWTFRPGDDALCAAAVRPAAHARAGWPPASRRKGPSARLTTAGGSVNLGRPRSLHFESGFDRKLQKRGTLAESSFDVVSSVDLQEVKNAIAQAMKEIITRFDLKGTASDITLTGEEITLASSDEFKIKAVRDVLESRLVKR